MNPFDTLGIPRTSSKEDARAAYRKLASKHHPDKGGDAEKFKDIQLAWEKIDAGFTTPAEPSKPKYTARPSSFTKPESVWRGQKRDNEPYDPFKHHKTYSAFKAKPVPKPEEVNRQSVIQAWRTEVPQREVLGDFIARVSMAEAYNGFLLEIDVRGAKKLVQMPRGMPNGLRTTIKIDGSEDLIRVITLFTQSAFKFKSAENMTPETIMISGEPLQVYRTGDLTYHHRISVQELDRIKSFEIEDFLGKKFKVEIPFDHHPRRPIIVPEKGYVDWCSSKSEPNDVRGNVLVYLNPTEMSEPINVHKW